MQVNYHGLKDVVFCPCAHPAWIKIYVPNQAGYFRSGSCVGIIKYSIDELEKGPTIL